MRKTKLNLARIIHEGSSSPTLTLPHSMGEGEGGGPFLVKRISRRPSFVKREAYLASRTINACERRDTRYERRVRNDASYTRAAYPRLQQKLHE
jgi:hypothetical protein